MKWFTSDWHLGDDRIGVNGKLNLYFRPFTSIQEQNNTIKWNFYNCGIRNTEEDELWHLGDVLYSTNNDSLFVLQQMRDRFPKVKLNLIIGNYDEDKLDILGNYFDRIVEQTFININDQQIYLNHYPIKCKKMLEEAKHYDFAITGHIHGLWKIQKGMVNVGVDAWHFKPVSETEIDFIMNVCKKYYDENVFPY